jgi:release factor glutamine methyltransferase
VPDDRPALADSRGVDTVYQAAEDSALLAEAAVGSIPPTALVLEVGTGSGYVADRIATETGARVVASDLNPEACRQARAAGLDVFRANLLDPVADGRLDVVVFNPPYLPTTPETEWGDWMEAALSGGESGRAVIEPFLADLARVLRPDGFGLLLASTLSDLDAVRSAATDAGLAPTVVAEESHPFERLVVFRLDPAPDPE